jgi:hypothetical protein
MSYTTCEAALETLLTGYTDGAHVLTSGGNLRRGDYRAKDEPGTTVACVITMGGDSDYADAFGTHRAHGKRQARHRPALSLFWKRGTALGGDGVAYEALRSYTDTLIAFLNRYPRINGATGVHRMQVSRASRIVQLRDSPHAAQRVELEVLEQTAVTPVESIG